MEDYAMWFAKRVPRAIVGRTEENYYTYHMSLLDAFEEAVKELAKKGTKLWKAWYYDDFREYLPSEYREEYLDFKKHPLKYAGKQAYKITFSMEDFLTWTI